MAQNIEIKELCKEGIRLFDRAREITEAVKREPGFVADGVLPIVWTTKSAS